LVNGDLHNVQDKFNPLLDQFADYWMDWLHYLKILLKYGVFAALLNKPITQLSH